MRKADLIVKVYSDDEYEEETSQLRRYGYKMTSNCYWYQRYEKDNWIVEIERNY